MKNGQAQESRWARSSIVQCPECSSYNAVALDIRPSKARCRCTDCGTVYWVRTVKIASDEGNGSAHEISEEGDSAPRRRKTKADYRAEITPAPPPNLPFLQKAVDSALSSGPCGIRQSQRLAINAAKRYMDDLCDHWRRDTRYLRDLMLNERESLRARARYARRWRTRFLAFLSVTDSPTLSARAAHVDQNTVYRHRERDPEFAKQWADASRIAIDLLEARVFQRAVEGDLEPVHYMGVVVDYARRFDSKLQIELLRAKRPETFKTPGAANINIGTRGDVFVLTEEQRHKLMDYNRAWLLDPTTRRDNTPTTPREEPPALPNDTTRDGLTQ